MKKAKINWGSSIREKGWEGLNNAAINSFNSHIINSFVREIFQNSNDARDNSLPVDPKTGKKPPLRISINYKEFTREQFPNFDDFLKTFERIKSAKENASHAEFFKNGEKALLNKKAIKFFVFEDFNTIGLEGNDNDNNRSFSSLVLSEGTSVKQDETAGGSFGIGKNAIFGISKLRTVFYVSLNRKKEYIFQGISKLASYSDSKGVTRDNRIFCGDGSTRKSIRDWDIIPSPYQNVFKRTVPGLSQFAACPVDNPGWMDEFTQAILRNYWLLLYTEDLVVELRENDNLIITLSKQDLDEHLFKYFNPLHYRPDKDIKPVGNPYEFYMCFTKGKKVSKNIDKLGKVNFYYRELDHTKTNKIAYMRNGMVIYSDSVWGFGSINYCGVFICENDGGNKLLRLMEPPTHDSFDCERLVDSKYTKSDGDKILNDIEELISNALQEIADKYKQSAEDIPWLDGFFSSFSGIDGAGVGKRTNNPSKNESPERIGDKMKMTVKFSSVESNTLINHDSGFEEGNTGKGKIKSKKAKGQKPKQGPLPGEKGKRTPIKSRMFKTDIVKTIAGEVNWEYRLFLESASDIISTDIQLVQKGDTGSLVNFAISEVTDNSGKPIKFTEMKNNDDEITSYCLKSVALPAQLKIYLREPYKSSFKLIN